MMISPECYIDQYKNASYRELIEARQELIEKLRALENYFKEPKETHTIMINPSEDVQYKMCLKYLESLSAIMIKRAPELTGEPYIDFPDESE